MAEVLVGRKRWLRGLLLLACVGLYLVLYFKNYWVCDDAYIIQRSVEQLHAGNGPRWNPHERVQAFTSPLWFIVLSAVRLGFRNPYFGMLWTGLACSLAVLGLLWRVAPSAGAWGIGILLLVSSQAYFDYTASGLENGLGYVLLLGTLACWLKAEAWNWNAGTQGGRASVPIRCANESHAMGEPLAWEKVWGMGGLAILLRHDLVILLLPVLLVSVWRALGFMGWRRVAGHGLVALSPFLLWTLFSLIYFGSAVPNTAYAKLNAGIPRGELVIQGGLYLASSCSHDSITILTIGVALVVCWGDRMRRRWAPVGLGIGLHLIYVVLVGGDFMRGRFLSFGFLFAVAIVANWLLLWAPKKLFLALGAVTLAYGALGTVTPFGFDPNQGSGPFLRSLVDDSVEPDAYMRETVDDASGVYNEKLYYFPLTSLWTYLREGSPAGFPISYMRSLGPKYDIWDGALDFPEQHLTVRGNLGFLGYGLALGDIVIDPFALTDPFLARTAVPKGKPWRIGHFQRALPRGYLASLAHGDNRLRSIELAELFDRVALVTQSADLLAPERLLLILRGW